MAGHDFPPWTSLSNTCKVCGQTVKGTTWLTALAGDPAVECPGAPAGVDFTQHRFVVTPTDTCECGAYKAMGIKKNQVGHSAWCPWK